jgi:capsular exopolysaccharide synthesis family protein
MNMPQEITITQDESLERQPTAAGDTLDLVVYWRSIARRKWSILGVAFALALVALIVVNAQTPIYRSTATLLIEQNKPRVSPTEEISAATGEGFNREFFQTQAEILKSRALAVTVVNKLDLTRHPDFDARQQERPLIDRFKQLLGLDVEEPVWSEEELHRAAVDSLIMRTSVDPVRLSQLIKVSFESPDPSTAANIANAIGDTFIESDGQARQQTTRRASEWLGGRLGGLKKNLDDSERELQAYRERARIIETRGLAQSGATSQVADLIGRLIAARQRTAAAEHAHSQVKNAKDHDILPVVMRNPLSVRFKEAESEAERRVAELANRYGPEHPRMVQAENELKTTRDNARRHVETVVASLAHEYELARANEQAAERTLAEAKSNVQQINRKEFDLGALERAVATNRQIYELFSNRFKETSASPDLKTSAIARVTDAARAPQVPVKPKKEQLVAIAFLLGLLLGALIALFLERLDNTLKSADDIEDKLDHPMLTMLPLLHGDRAKAVGRHYLDDPKSVFSEAIRTARTGVLLSAADPQRLTLLVTSSVPDEGKTAVAINLALAEAQTRRVLLVDADLRRPSVGAKLALDPNKPGLTDLLSGAATFAQCLQRIEGSSLYVIGSGPIPLNPLELVISQRFQQLVKALAGSCEVLVIDSPPVHLVSDALVLSKLATGVVFVVKADSTPYPLVRRCLRALEEVEANIFGITLNQLDFRKADRYYGAYTGSYYNYDGYYTEESKSLNQRHAQPVAALRS